MKIEDKIEQYLNEETKQYIDTKDTPDWVKPIVKKSGIAKPILVVIAPNVRIPSNWHDANVRYIYLYDKGKIVSITGIGCPSVNDTQEETVAKEGFTADLNINRMVLLVQTYPKAATLYVSPESMGNLLPTENKSDLTPEESMALYALKAFKSSYRRSELERYNVNFDKALPGLISKGLATKMGSITKEGRNLMLSNDIYNVYSISALADRLGLKSKYGF